MEPQILKIQGDFFLYWNEELLKVNILSQKYANRYGDATYLLECDEKFTYDNFKKLKGTQFPNNFCATSYCKIKSYPPVYILYISRVESEIIYRFTPSYDLDKWQEDVHLKKFCGKLWEAFTLAGFKTEEKPELEEGSFYIPVSVAHSPNKVIEDAVEESCSILNEIHLSVFKELCVKSTESVQIAQNTESTGQRSLNMTDVIKITKYKGKFFEIDIPKIIERIFNKNDA
ncbi:MAG: hypothetical protein KAU60_08035 [Desulfobacterales bacterium]|nr:hypothetical protein [Desulfobacterales bacterium]